MGGAPPLPPGFAPQGVKKRRFLAPGGKGGPQGPQSALEASGGRERGLGGRCAGRVRATKWQGPDQRRNERSDFRADSSRAGSLELRRRVDIFCGVATGVYIFRS